MDKVKYNSYYNIPARVFFEIKETQNLQLLRPKPNVSGDALQRLFMQINDDDFIKSENPDATRYLQLLDEIEILTYKKKSIRDLLDLIWKYPAELWFMEEYKEQRDSVIDMANSLLDTPLNIEGDINAEINRALQVDLGIIDNEINEAEIELNELKAKGNSIEFDFFDHLQSINECNAPSSIPSTCLLAEYRAAEKSAYKKSERAKLKQNNG